MNTNHFAQAARRTNRFSVIMIIIVFISMFGGMYGIVNLVVINVIQINTDNIQKTVETVFASWDEDMNIDEVTNEMRRAVYNVRRKTQLQLTKSLIYTCDRVYIIIKVMFMFCFVFTFCTTIAISRSFVATLDMQLANLGPASLTAIKGTIEEMERQYDIKEGKRK
jgi:hypothetical protein